MCKLLMSSKKNKEKVMKIFYINTIVLKKGSFIYHYLKTINQEISINAKYLEKFSVTLFVSTGKIEHANGYFSYWASEDFSNYFSMAAGMQPYIRGIWCSLENVLDISEIKSFMIVISEKYPPFPHPFVVIKNKYHLNQLLDVITEDRVTNAGFFHEWHGLWLKSLLQISLVKKTPGDWWEVHEVAFSDINPYGAPLEPVSKEPGSFYIMHPNYSVILSRRPPRWDDDD
jgi:hypothetical protein